MLRRTSSKWGKIGGKVTGQAMSTEEGACVSRMVSSMSCACNAFVEAGKKRGIRGSLMPERHLGRGSMLTVGAHDMRSTDARATEGRATEARATEARATEARTTEARTTEARTTEARLTRGILRGASPAAERAAAYVAHDSSHGGSECGDGSERSEPAGLEPVTATGWTRTVSVGFNAEWDAMTAVCSGFCRGSWRRGGAAAALIVP
eukprot:2283489-Prymnesium_polylepis.1